VRRGVVDVEKEFRVVERKIRSDVDDVCLKLIEKIEELEATGCKAPLDDGKRFEVIDGTEGMEAVRGARHEGR